MLVLRYRRAFEWFGSNYSSTLNLKIGDRYLQIFITQASTLLKQGACKVLKKYGYLLEYVVN